MSDPLKIGDTIRDNDPRTHYARELKVLTVADDYVTAQQLGHRPTKIKRKRVYTDDKVRRTGFSRIPKA